MSARNQVAHAMSYLCRSWFGYSFYQIIAPTDRIVNISVEIRVGEVFRLTQSDRIAEK